MKFLVVFAAFAALATAEQAVPQNDRLLNIIGAIINHLRPPIAVGPAIVDDSPISVGPAIVDDSPISVGPAIVDDSPISVGPAIVDDSPISVGPVIIDDSINVEGETTNNVKPTPVSPFPVIPDLSSLTSPLVQVIINVKSDSASVNPVVVEESKPEIKPTPVIVVEQPEIKPTPVNVVEQPEVAPESVIVTPIQTVPVETAPIAVLPILN